MISFVGGTADSTDDTHHLLSAVSISGTADSISMDATGVALDDESLTTPLLYTSSHVPDVVQSSEV